MLIFIFYFHSRIVQYNNSIIIFSLLMSYINIRIIYHVFTWNIIYCLNGYLAMYNSRHLFCYHTLRLFIGKCTIRRT